MDNLIGKGEKVTMSHDERGRFRRDVVITVEREPNLNVLNVNVVRWAKLQIQSKGIGLVRKYKAAVRIW